MVRSAIQLDTRPTRGFWAQQIALDLGAPVNTHTLLGLVAWMAGEGTQAVNNPLATTRRGHGGLPFNSAGVRNYPTFADGLQATIETLLLSSYTKLVAAIRAGKSAHDIARLVVASPWGTEHVPLEPVLRAPVRSCQVRVQS